MYDRMRCLCAPFLLTAFVIFCMSSAAIADDENDAWHVNNAFGNVWVTVGGAPARFAVALEDLKAWQLYPNWPKRPGPFGARRGVHIHLAKLGDRNS